MHLKSLIFPGVLLLVMTWVSTASADDKEAQAEALVQDLMHVATDILSDQGGSLLDRETQFHDIVREKFDFHFISTLVAGKYWAQMTEAQKSEFQKLFSDFFLKSYAPLLGGYPGDNTVLLFVKRFGLKDVYVQTEIRRKKRRTVRSDWRIRDVAGMSRIIDLAVSGTSVGFSHKAGFQRVIEKRGIEGLLGLLRLRAEQVAAQR